MGRLANADLLPYDALALGRYLRSLTSPLASLARQRRVTIDVAPLEHALDRFIEQGAALDTLLNAVPATLPPAKLAAANTALRGVGPAFTRPDGLKGRPWQRNLVIASDRDNGYADVTYPGITEAVKDSDGPRAALEIGDLAARVDSATALLATAVGALRAK